MALPQAAPSPCPAWIVRGVPPWRPPMAQRPASTWDGLYIRSWDHYRRAFHLRRKPHVRFPYNQDTSVTWPLWSMRVLAAAIDFAHPRTLHRWVGLTGTASAADAWLMPIATLMVFTSTSANGSRAGARAGDACVVQEQQSHRPVAVSGWHSAADVQFALKR